MLTILENITIAKISQHLASNDIANGGMYGQRPNPMLPIQLYVERKAVEFRFNYETTLLNTSGIASITIGTIGSAGDGIEVTYIDPLLGLISFGAYTSTVFDTTASILATSIVAVLSLNAYGYTFGAVNNVIIVTAPIALGNAVNSTSLIVTLTAADNFLMINSTDTLLINSTDKITI